MNANEIIKYSEEAVEFYEGSRDICGDAIADRKIDFFNSVIAALSATIPRETAKCKPEQEDGDKNGLVLGWCADYGYYDAYNWRTIAEVTASLPFWLPMPAAPEATP